MIGVHHMLPACSRVLLSARSSRCCLPVFRGAVLDQQRAVSSVLVRQCHSHRDDKTITDTSVLVEQGIRIDELPCIVRIVHGEFIIHEGQRTLNGTKFHGITLQTLKNDTNSREVNRLEEQEMVSGFNRCTSLSDLYFLLSYCPEDEVTPPVALAIINNLIQLENNKKFRTTSMEIIDSEADKLWIKQTSGSNIVTFTRAAVMERLVNTICKSSNPALVMEAVKVLRKDTNKEEKTVYLKQLCNECLLLVSDGKLSVTQIAALAQDLHLLKENFTKHFADKLWPGLEAGIQDLDEDGLCELFSMLPYINLSRNYVFHLAEKRALNIWYKFKPKHIAQIMSILVTCNCYSHKLVCAISRWTNVNIHILSEAEFRWILLGFTKLQFIDDNIKKALIRYTKARRTQISDHILVSVITDYCNKTSFRSPEVLDVCSEYFIKHHSSLTVPDIWNICKTFGELNYTPTDSYTFFKVLESLLDRHFSAFPPDLFMDLLLSCVYLERYPLNFVKKVFHPFFIRRIEYLKPIDAKRTVAKLRILDKAMSLEASCYNGPMVIRSHHGSNYAERDMRVVRSILHLRRVLLDIAGDPNRLFIPGKIPGFPISDLYRVDCMIDTNIKPDVASLLPAGLQKRLALLVHIPEHYDHSKKHLLGPHAMRRRHFQLVGLEVVNLEYNVLSSLHCKPDLAKQYIIQKIMDALDKND